MYNIEKTIYNVLIYLRKSREDIELERLTGEDTLSKHRLMLSNIAKDRNYNFDIRSEVESGDSISGRPVFQSVLNTDLPSRKYQAIMVTEISRLGRSDMVDCGIIMRTLKDNNLLIITPSKIYDINNSSDSRQIRFELFLAREEYELIKERLKRGKDITIAKGNSPYGISYALGYESHKGRLRIIPEQAMIIKRIFELRAEKYSYSQIAGIVNELGYKTKKDTVFHSTTIGKILKNRMYIGYVKFQNMWHKGSHEPIISDELWNKAQLVNKENTHEHPTHISSPYIVDLHCAICGKRMHGDIHILKSATNPIRVRIYRCRNSEKIHEEYNYVYAGPLHDYIKDQIKIILSNKEFLKEYNYYKNKQIMLHSNKYSSQLVKLQNEIQKKEDFMIRCQSDYESGVLPVSLYVNHFEKTNNELQACKLEIQKLNDKIGEVSCIEDDAKILYTASDIVNRWDDPSITNMKKLLIKQLFDKIEYDIRSNKVRVYGIINNDVTN